MSDEAPDPTISIVVGTIFGAVIILLVLRFIHLKCENKNKCTKNDKVKPASPANSTSPTKVVPDVPEKIKLRRKATHDPKDSHRRKIIERTRIGVEMIFREFDRSCDNLIDGLEVNQFVKKISFSTNICHCNPILPSALYFPISCM